MRKLPLPYPQQVRPGKGRVVAPRSPWKPSARHSRAQVPGVRIRHPHLGAQQLHRLVLSTVLHQKLLHLGLVVLLLGRGWNEDEGVGGARMRTG